uniref:GATA-type domain-containing protein n=1 Tax=Meloidogyne enterolobii TaxID=390850 RepID=A0A6V7W3U3_MELEN|nr:unnamed protein product [Meloidogyne enterolobii]
MISKFIILHLLHLIILLNIQCAGRIVPVEVKIKNDWEGKREFIYLKNVEQEKRFVLKKIEKRNNKYVSHKHNIKDFLCPINFDSDKNIFDTSTSTDSKYSPSVQLKNKIVIEIANNQIIQNILPEFEKRILQNNIFKEVNNKCYETCILDENLEKIKNFKDLNSIKENYENKLLSSYWSEINLIAYKIELLKKQKVEYSKGENERIVYIGKKIIEINDGTERHCFNCWAKQTSQWYTYLKGRYLCYACLTYRRRHNGRLRPQELLLRAKKQIPIKDRQCYICKSTKWVNYRDSESGNYLCTSCYRKQHHEKKTNKNLEEKESNK